jgi:amino acid transporter/nucleotide-binding universal stress UspA family protein
MEWFASSVAGSVYALTLAIYVLDYLEKLGLLWWDHTPQHIAVMLVGLMAAAFFVYVNYRGASDTGKMGAFFTLGQTATLLFVGVLGVIVVLRDPTRLQNFEPFLPKGWGKLLVTMGFTYVAFEGFEVIAQAGDETIEPRRNLPKAMLLSILIAALTYVVVAFAAVVAVDASDPTLRGLQPWEWIGSFREVGFSAAVGRLLPAGLGNLLVTIAVIFAATSALNATTYSATRAVYALGRDQFLPSHFARLSRKRRTPVFALLGTAVIIMAVAGFLPTMDVASSASMMFLALFFIVNLCVIKIRRHMSDELQYGYVMPLFPIPPIVGILAQVCLAVELRQISIAAWIVAPGWILLGALTYLFYGRTHVTQTRDEIVTLKEKPPPSEKAFRIMVPVSNPDNALKMVMQTLNIAEAYDAQVELVHMVPIPDQIPLSDAGRYTDPGEEAIAEAMLYLTSRFPVSHTVRYCRNPARGILSAAREHQANLLIMGWRGRSQRHDFLFGSTLDPILERCPCDVIILKNCTERTYKKILVPFAGGPHSLFALRTASILIDRENGVIIPFNVTVPGKPTVDVDAFLKNAEGELHCPLDRFKPEYAVSKNVEDAVAEQAEECDLVIVGATGGRRLRQLAVGSLPETLASRISSPLIMVKARTPVKSLVDRWL